MSIAIDAGVRIANCYSYLTRRIERVGVAVVAAVSDRGLVDRIYFETASPETRDYEIELAKHYSRRYDVCIFDGPPVQACRYNVGVIKTGRFIDGWRCILVGPYAICADFDAGNMARSIIKLNNVAHRVAHTTAKLLFQHLLTKRRCVVAVGTHVVPELSYYTEKEEF